MSAIYGKLNFNKKAVNTDELYQMENALNHWHADDKSIWHHGCIGMGHLMLYNTPESLHEKLPFYNSESRLTITFGGRIDNRDELFNKLNFPKNHQHLIADSTLILKAYEKYGEDCVQHLIGDFAFAIWDEKEQKLFCARDHMGVKPFFYYRDDHFFAFATEAKGLLAIDGLNKEIDDVYILKLVANYKPERRETAYKHIKRLNCASALIVKNDVVTQRQYWELDTKREIIYKNKEEYIENFRAVFTEAVNCRLRSSYLVGTELSGGIDSCGIASVAANLLHAEDKKIASFSSFPASKDSYENPLESEEAYADETISFAAIDFVYKRPNNAIEDDFLNEMDSRTSVYGYPSFAAIDWNSSFYKTAQTMNIRTILSGHGGDQLVTDRSQSYLLQYINDGKLNIYIKEAVKKWGISQTLKNLISAKLKQPPPNFVKKMVEHYLSSRLKNAENNFLAPGYFNQIKPHVHFKNPPKTFREAQKQNIIDNVFISDRMEYETLNGLNYKICPAFPMQDIRLMEYVLAVPTFEKMHPRKDSLLYRTAMQGLMPDMVTNKKTKHIAPLVPPQPGKWLTRQTKVKNWILEIGKNKRLPPFINYTKLLKGYEWQQDGKVDFNSLITPKRKQVESIIRWFEKNNDKRLQGLFKN